MPIHATLHRYALIIEKISKQKGCTLKVLSDYLSKHDLSVSERTVSRFIEQMRHEFGLDIAYDTIGKGYVLLKQNEREIDNFLNFIHLAQTAGITYKDQKELKELMDFLQFDSNQRISGIEYLKDLLFAIQNRRFINFKHTNFNTTKITPYRVKPLLLKQYQYRWYIVGEIEENEFRTFGCDRISDIEIETKTFPAKKTKEIRNNFEKIIGLDYSNEEIEKVKIELTPLQARYVLASPLHSSQYIFSESRDSTVIALDLIPNYELIQKILMLGDQARVLAPASLRFEVKKMLIATLEKYKK